MSEEKTQEEIATRLNTIDSRMRDLQKWTDEIHTALCNKVDPPLYDLLEAILEESKKANAHLENLAAILKHK